MEMPDLKPVVSSTARSRRLTVIGITVFIVAVLAYAYWINLP